MKQFAIAFIACISCSAAQAGVLTCVGTSPIDQSPLTVVADSSAQTLTINGDVAAAQFMPGPQTDLKAVVSATAFLGVSTAGYTQAVLNTEALEQVELTCDGQTL